MSKLVVSSSSGIQLTELWDCTTSTTVTLQEAIEAGIDLSYVSTEELTAELMRRTALGKELE
jgi:hypothetical protein